MTTTETLNRKPPTKAQAMKALIEAERELMVKENTEAKQKKAEAWEELNSAVLQYFRDNLETLASKVTMNAYNWSAQIQVSLVQSAGHITDSSVLMPPHILKLHKTWESINERPCGYNPMDQSERDVRKRINDKLKRVNASAVINSNGSVEPERPPVVKEYLTEFLASLNKASKAAERLEA